MWFDGYNRNKIETPVYSDVAIQIKHWRITQNIKLYVLSNGWVEATKRFMAKTNHGDLNLLIDGHFDSTSGPLDDPNTFRRVVEQISLPPTQVLFLTKSPSENKAALEAGLNSILVMTHRRDLARLDDKMKKNICYQE
ncbi:enolase-phosphatase E-1-like protein 1 [Sarcoptes scabiei]|uniref:Enolase-phosphatase E-1-like protein 1 n=1 Tax=Sarcoptes scabiei TaxID=52283 RepID=A0A132A2J7_SARSC|nr:enolase-phosphatase E-1-like protein 1 [Sarcoptes scabiei]